SESGVGVPLFTKESCYAFPRRLLCLSIPKTFSSLIDGFLLRRGHTLTLISNTNIDPLISLFP
ncbi:unnamed protein product, partial [Amoebophrya sp. A25]